MFKILFYRKILENSHSTALFDQLNCFSQTVCLAFNFLISNINMMFEWLCENIYNFLNVFGYFMLIKVLSICTEGFWIMVDFFHEVSW